MAVLDEFAADWLSRPQRRGKIEIVGHTCNLGDAEYNLKLSLKRAEAVKAYLVKKGVPEAEIGPVKGYGAALPIYDNRNREGRRMNRRVSVR